METYGFSSSMLAACVLGLAAHLLYFIRGEHHRHSIEIAIAGVGLIWLTWLLQLKVSSCSWNQATFQAISIACAFTASLLTSMFLYRFFFHPLHSIPGPKAAKLSKLWHARLSSHFGNYREMHKLHAAYGEYVRTGCGELELINSSIVLTSCRTL